MQYTVDKYIYFLYSAKPEQHQQQSAATMPSKPAVTGKCQCFKTPTPLMSAGRGALMCLLRVHHEEEEEAPRGTLPSTQQARTMHTPVQDIAKKRNAYRSHHSAHNPADALVPFCQIPPASLLEHLGNNSSNGFSSQRLELQHLKLTAAGTQNNNNNNKIQSHKSSLR